MTLDFHFGSGEMVRYRTDISFGWLDLMGELPGQYNQSSDLLFKHHLDFLSSFIRWRCWTLPGMFPVKRGRNGLFPYRGPALSDEATGPVSQIENQCPREKQPGKAAIIDYNCEGGSCARRSRERNEKTVGTVVGGQNADKAKVV